MSRGSVTSFFIGCSNPTDLGTPSEFFDAAP